MNTNTGIEWTDATWNPVTGCTKVSAGCKNCYAERVFPRAYGKFRAFTDVRCHEDRLEQPLHWKKPRMVFVNSMSDLFHEAVPFEFIKQIWDVMARAQQHSFQILTKRPKRMLEFTRWMAGADDISTAHWPGNCWLGVSVEDQKTANERIPLLLQTPAAVRFISYEPALGPIEFGECGWLERWSGKYSTLPEPLSSALASLKDVPGIDWVIAGSESGPKARGYETEWFASVARQCEQSKVAFFMKQLTERGRKIPFEQWPGSLQVREFPK